jgi:hypothetical protein
MPRVKDRLNNIFAKAAIIATRHDENHDWALDIMQEVAEIAGQLGISDLEYLEEREYNPVNIFRKPGCIINKIETLAELNKDSNREMLSRRITEEIGG